MKFRQSMTSAGNSLSDEPRRIAFYGGSFDPVHNGHLKIGRSIVELFELDEFVYIPAFHAPHKKDKRPTSAFHRFAMLSLATKEDPQLKVSKMELELPERPFTIETLARLKAEFPADQLFFVMGADSWQEITTWRDWEGVLTAVNVIVVTRPPLEIGFSHVTEAIRSRIVDLRGKIELQRFSDDRIYITDAVSMDISATEIRQQIRSNEAEWREKVPAEAAKYIEKYKFY
jgi:nicotinate-nucleotide adenylyltransferase